MVKISQNKLEASVVKGANVSSSKLESTTTATLASTTIDTGTVQTSITLPIDKPVDNNGAVYYKSADGLLYGYINGKEVKISGGGGSVTLTQASNFSYLVTDLVRTDESVQELFVPEMLTQDDANFSKATNTFLVETPAQSISYRIFDITPTMNPSLSATLPKVVDIATIDTTKNDINQLLYYKIIDIFTQKPTINSISLSLDIDPTYRFDNINFNCSASDVDAVFDLINSNLKTGFGYILIANSGEELVFYVTKQPVKNATSVSVEVYTNKDQSFSPASSQIPSLIWDKLYLGTNFSMEADVSYLKTNDPTIKNFVIERFNLVHFQDKTTKKTASLLVSYNSLMSNFGTGLSADNQLYVENLPTKLVDLMVQKISANVKNNLAISIARLPLIAAQKEGIYYSNSNLSDTEQFAIVDPKTSGKLRRIEPCAISNDELLFKSTMFANSGTKYIDAFLIQSLVTKLSYSVATELLDVTNIFRSIISNDLTINSIFFSNYIGSSNNDSWVNWNKAWGLFMERGSLFYETLSDEAYKSSTSGVNTCSFRSYFYLGRDQEPVKDDTAYISQSAYSSTSQPAITQFSINNISTNLLRNIRIPQQGNRYKPNTDIVLSISGSKVAQVQNAYLTNVLYN